jgi:hypothetical protein
MIRRLTISAGLIALVSLPVDAANLTPAFSQEYTDWIESPAEGIYVGITSGTNFSPKSDLLVEAIGVFDTGVDGLFDPWEVAIFDVETRERLRVELIPTESTETTRVGEFKYVSISPLRLKEGFSYQIAAYNFAKGRAIEGWPGRPGFTLGASADINVLGAFLSDLSYTGEATFSELPFGVYRFGGSFLYRSIPEPSALLLASLCVGLSVARSRG